MKNLISPFSIVIFKKDIFKNINNKDSFMEKKLVHHRRDLDSLEEYINFR